jgi:TonB-linked SusC/RagA family outer membrane protein
MRKIAMMLVFLLFAGLQVVLAQRAITGRVTDNQGQPLIGVTVLVKGTTIGTTTDADGKFSIQVPDDQAALQLSYVGYTAQEVVVGSQVTVNVTLAESSFMMNEVVVTALGIKREAKSLGYSTSTVSTAQITEARTVNVGNSLIGKIAGMNVTAPPTGPGGSSKIRIRGQSSFGGDNSPLIVVNGVPISNSADVSAQNADLGDGLQSINPEDIESMTVLKGATAAALYGYRAKDGVIIITTKSGRGQKGIGIELNSGFQADQALDYTDFQYEYGQGESGIRAASVADAQKTGVWSFGTKFDGAEIWNVDGKQHPYVPYKDNIKNFYNTGLIFNNSVALSGGNEQGGFRLSLSNSNANSITPETTLKKNIIDLGLNYNLTEKFSVGLNANYSIEKNHNPPAVGGQDYNINNTLYTLANSIDQAWLEFPYKDPVTLNEQPLSRFTNRTNPYWTIYERFEDHDRNRIFGNIMLKYQFTDWLYVQGRMGQDYYSVAHDYNSPTGTAFLTAPASGFNGTYYQDQETFNERNLDFLIGANHKFGDIGISATFGGNSMDQIGQTLSTSVTNFYVRDLYTIGNGQTKNPGFSYWHKRVNSLYGTLDLSFRDYLFLNATGRNDWFSTLNPESNSYLYPSVSLSFLFTEALASVMPEWLNYGKIRAAYAEVGGDTSPYTNQLFYGVNTNTFNGFALGYISSSTSPNPDLKPLKVKESEIGLELIMFDRRISLDVAGYIKNTVDEILNVDISQASGYGSTKVNLGRLKNQGVEMLLTLVPVRNSSFTWETAFNYTHNKSEVLELAGGQARIDVGSGDFFGTLSHEVGMPLASLRGFDYKRNTDGTIQSANGRFLQGNIITFGSAIPTDIAGWLNTFTYKGFRLFAQFDYKGGHKIMSNTNMNMLRHGLHKMSLNGREGGVIFDGVNVDGSPNSVAVEAESFYADYRSKAVATPFVYDGSFIKFRTLSLGTDLSKYVSKTFIKGLNVNAYVNNVALLVGHVDNLDPETVYATSDNKSGLESSAMPTTRSYGLNLNIKF